MDETTRTIEAADYRQRLDFTAPPEAVFAALSTPAGVSAWWTPTTGSGAEGGELRPTFPPGPAVFRVDSARPALVAWTVLECDFMPDWVGTRIVFALRPGPEGGTALDFCHEGLTPQLECYDMCRQGWGYYLPSLHAQVETGRGHPGPRPRS